MPSSIEAIVNSTFLKEEQSILEKISDYLTLLFKWHDTHNIISSSDKEYVIQREIYDSYEFSKLLTGRSISDIGTCLLYTSPSPRDLSTSRMPSSA